MTGRRSRLTLKAQYPLSQEYTLNHIKDPYVIYGILLNLGVLGSLGITGRMLHYVGQIGRRKRTYKPRYKQLQSPMSLQVVDVMPNSFHKRVASSKYHVSSYMYRTPKTSCSDPFCGPDMHNISVLTIGTYLKCF